MKKVRVAEWDALEDRRPMCDLVANVDLVVMGFDDDVSVLSDSHRTGTLGERSSS